MRPTRHAWAPQVAQVAHRIRSKLKPSKWELRIVKVCQLHSSFLFCLTQPAVPVTQEHQQLQRCVSISMHFASPFLYFMQTLQNLFNQGKVYTHFIIWNTSPNEAKIWGVHGAMHAMPDYNTSSPVGMELAQLTEVVSCNITVTQKTTVQMQIQSMTGPCSRIFLLLLIKILSSLYLFISWIPPK